MKKKIVFDWLEFKKFLSTLDETTFEHSCRSPIDWTIVSYYINKDGVVKAKRECHMLNESIKTDYDYYDDTNIKGEIIYE